MSEALELRKKKMTEAPGSGAESSEEEDEESKESKEAAYNKGHEELPPLTSSTNPQFPNAIMKKPANTHARHAVPKPDQPPQEQEQEKEPERPRQVSPRVSLSGKNAPSTPHGLTTRSRRSLAADSEHAEPGEQTEQAQQQPEEVGGEHQEGDEKMVVDE